MLIANYDYEIDKKVSTEEAYIEGKKEVVLNMLKDGLPIEKVAKYSGITLGEVEELQRHLQK